MELLRWARSWTRRRLIMSSLIDDAVGTGATLLSGGKGENVVMPATVVDGVTDNMMKIYRDESFGPVVAVIRAEDEADAIRIANDSEYGLSAAVFTRETEAQGLQGTRQAQRESYGWWQHQEPTIAMVNGWCFGGGYGPLFACDLAFCADEAQFGLSEINWGILPGGGASNPAAQIERFVDAGIPMSDGFGMTETCSNFGMPVGDAALLKEKAGSISLPYFAVEACIVDDAGCDGDVGELWVRGASVAKGYWNQPEKTAEAFEGEWFKTGDAAHRDEDGFYYRVD